MKIFYFVLAILVGNIMPVTGQEYSAEQKVIVSQMKALSASMQKDGSGGIGYAKILSSDYTRWTSGNDKINDRAVWLKGINDWFNSGWRIANSDNKILEIKLQNHFAFVRRIATETYAGPNGESQTFQSGMVEIWRKQDNQWLLLQASVSPKQIN